MSIREEFEAWYKREIFPYELFTKDRSGNYRSIACQGQWRAWQESRRQLVVDLPEVDTWSPRSDALSAYKIECREAIEAAGVRVKP